jgi:hypothetical protein
MVLAAVAYAEEATKLDKDLARLVRERRRAWGNSVPACEGAVPMRRWGKIQRTW